VGAYLNVLAPLISLCNGVIVNTVGTALNRVERDAVGGLTTGGKVKGCNRDVLCARSSSFELGLEKVHK
jgi:hypothetical protein